MQEVLPSVEMIRRLRSKIQDQDEIIGHQRAKIMGHEAVIKNLTERNYSLATSLDDLRKDFNNKVAGIREMERLLEEIKVLHNLRRI